MAVSFRLFSCSAATTQTAQESAIDHHEVICVGINHTWLITPSLFLEQLQILLLVLSALISLGEHLLLEFRVVFLNRQFFYLANYIQHKEYISSTYLEKLLRVRLDIVDERGSPDNTDGGA